MSAAADSPPATVVDSPPATVAVVSWNTREQLDGCLRSLAPDGAAGLADVWVVDNDSVDGSAELVAEHHPEVRLVRAGANLGFGAAVNLVARQTVSPWVVAANADVRLRPGALARLLDTGRRAPHAGILAPRLLGPDGRPERSVHAFPAVPYTAALALGLASADDARAGLLGAGRAAWLGQAPAEVDWAYGALLLIRRAAWSELGGFDERFWLHAEDLDLCWRARRTGWAVLFEPRAVVEHTGSASTGPAFGAALDARVVTSTYAWMLHRRGLRTTRAAAGVNVAAARVRATAWAAARRLAGLVRAPEPTRARLAWRRDQHRRWAEVHRAGLGPAEGLGGHR